MMSRHPVAGVVWQTIHYLVGLERLGYEVYYVEAGGHQPSSMLTTHGNDDGDHDRSRDAANFIAQIMQRFDLTNRWAFHALHSDSRCYGLSESQLRDLYDSAALLVNLHGATEPLPGHYATGRLVYLETDPVALQIELHDDNVETIEFLKPHCAFFTFGENYGRPGCSLPTSERFKFQPTRQPIIVDLWNQGTDEPREAFTTIGNWQQEWRDVAYDGDTYRWSKHLEFLKFLELPQRTAQSLELALSRCGEADRQVLRDHGWRVTDALSFSTDLDAYRRYITTSRAEFTVAKDQNVRFRSGWFSDRSASYLASGRPVITQDTGFGDILPHGSGLFSFSTMEDIEGAIESINDDYARHSREATAIAREYFNYDVVLSELLRRVGM